MSALVPRERIEQTILVIRGHNVMLDSDLAQLYGVTVGRLNEAVKRNEDRFPGDFTFQLTKPEFENLKSQIARSSSKWGGRRHAPYAFTEQGLAMLSRTSRPRVTRDGNLCGHDLNVGRIAQSLQQLFAIFPRQPEGANVSQAQARDDIAYSRQMLALKLPIHHGIFRPVDQVCQ